MIIIDWHSDKESIIEQKYAAFEDKYDEKKN